jgi:hypothetical protein
MMQEVSKSRIRSAAKSRTFSQQKGRKTKKKESPKIWISSLSKLLKLPPQIFKIRWQWACESQFFITPWMYEPTHITQNSTNLVDLYSSKTDSFSYVLFIL